MSAQPPERTIRLDGPVLVLTEDPQLIAEQLSGKVDHDPRALLEADLRDDISTDEIIPGWCCYRYGEELGDYAYLGMRDRRFGWGAIRALAPQVIVSGASKGCGSSREHAVYAEKYAGAELVFARSFERIYEQNCRNVGIVPCDDFEVLRALLDGEELPLSAFTRKAGGVERTIVAMGGLFGFNRARAEAGELAGVAFDGPRPLNVVEKIIQGHLAADTRRPPGGTVRVGESYFLEADVRFSHEYVTPMAAEMFRGRFGEEADLADPGSCYFFQDHLSLAAPVLRRRPKGDEMIAQVDHLNRRQEEFAKLSGGNFVGPGEAGGSRAICHNYIVEAVARPGDLIVGTDSHTCTAGAVGALALGVGATDIANAWFNRQVLVRVPPVIGVELEGRLRTGVCAKDAVLTLLAHPVVQERRTQGAVLIFSGEGCAGLDMDERATLCNMAVEAGAVTALVEPDRVTEEHLAGRGARAGGMPAADPGAVLAATVSIDLGAVGPMVALPGDPKNALPLASVEGEVVVDKVYGGSCTGGKARDMDMYASVLGTARSRGLHVPPGVKAYIQMGSEAVMGYARERGYVDLFEAVGVEVLPPSCGACINAGPGASETAEEVTVSAQNRNFPGRSGPGQVYLASPYVVAASALLGRLGSVEEALGAEVGAR